MDARELILDSLDKRGSAYRENLKSCQDKFSKDAVHDLRTSIRRLLAILDVIAFVTSASRIEKLSDRLKEQLDGISNLRDIQVMLGTVSENLGESPELEPLQDYLEKHEKRKQRSDEKQVENIKLGSINKRLLKIQQAVEELAPEELQAKLPQAVDEAHLKVIQRYSEIDRAQLASIHHLRVAFKNFRYMVEAIHPCLPDFPETLLKRMQDYQTQMGDIHDIQVFLETLAEFAEDSDSYDPRPLRRFYEQSITEKVSQFFKIKDDVLDFWRATPLSAFPWQGGEQKKER